MPSSNLPADIVIESRYQEKYDGYAKILPRMKEVQLGIELILRNKPTIGVLIDMNANYWRYGTDEMFGMPGFNIVYEYNELSNTVHLLSLSSKGVVL